MNSITQKLTILVLCMAVLASAKYPWPGKRLRGPNVHLARTDADIANLANNWKANSVRLQFSVSSWLDTDGSWETKIQSAVNAVRLHRKYGLYSVINPWINNLMDDGLFFSDADKMRRYKEMWVAFATHYADSGDGFAYDIMNEPHGDLHREKWPEYCQELIDAIRQVDTVHPIVVEPTEWGGAKGFIFLQPVKDDNVVYSFHWYEPHNYTHQGIGVYPTSGWNKDQIVPLIQPALTFRDKHNVTIWVGEFGCDVMAQGASRWFDDCLSTWEENNIGWSYYSYREWATMNIERNPAIVQLFKSYFALPEDFAGINGPAFSGNAVARTQQMQTGVVVFSGATAFSRTVGIDGRSFSPGRANACAIRFHYTEKE